MQVLVRRMQQGFVPCKNDKPKNAEISPFKAGSDYSLSANHRMNIRTTFFADFGAKDVDRLSPFKNDKPKDA